MGGALQELPLHLATEIATSVGDLTSLVQLQHTCSTANDLLLQPVTWSDKHAGVIVSSAIRKGWLQGTSRLAQALSASRIVANVASAVKFQYLLNDTRYRHSVDRRELTLLPSGTTSNESLHHELNTWFRETAACLHSQNIALRSLLSVIRIRTKAHIHKSAFHLKLRLFHFLKLLLHNQALYKPMQQQVTQSALVHRALQGRKNVILPAAAWKTWCSGLTGAGVVPKKATLRVAKQAADVGSALKAKKQQEPSASSRSVKGKKRMPTLPKAKATRRAPFRLRVLNPVIRPGRKYRDV